METALQIGLTNVAVAAVIALVAAGASLIRSRPALAHALWLLVILKLLTPPLWGMQVDWRRARALQATVEQPTVERSRQADPIPSVKDTIGSAIAVPGQTEAKLELPQSETASPASVLAAPNSIRLWTRPASGPAKQVKTFDLGRMLGWLPVVATLLWLFGSLVCAVVILLRVVRFHRLLRFATLASPALQGRAAALARRMGMAHAPQVWFVPGAVSPMLWPLGRSPRVLIPSQLWDRLGEGQRSSLLAHELAHLRRRDHWVRLPEVLASVLYWWCPLMWIARRRLREAEEQCCDAWVVWALPDGARDYASALLETVDFVTAGGRPPLPVLASGMGQFHQLRRRLVMIKHARIPRSLSGPGWLAVGALALGLLPLAPSLAQVGVSTTPPADPNNVASDVVPVAPAPPIAPTPARVSVQTTPVVAGEPETVSATVTEIAPIASSAAPAPPAPEADTSIINDLKSKPVPKNATSWGSKSAGNYASGDARLDKAREEARNEVYDLSMKLKLAEQRLKDLEMAAGQMKADVTVKLSRGQSKGEVPATPGAPTPPPVAPGYYPPPKTNFENAYGSSYGKLRMDRNATRESRLDAIEANLKALLDEVHALRDKPSSDLAPRSKEPAK